MDCEHIQENLSAYIDGMLSNEDKKLVESHLASCDTCTGFLADITSAINQVKSVNDVEPPAWLTRKVMARIKAEDKPRKNLFQKLFYPLHVKLPLEAIATIAIVATSFYIFRSMPPEIKYRGVPAKTEIPKALSESSAVPEREQVSKPEDASTDLKLQDAAGKDDELRLLKKELPAPVLPGREPASAPPDEPNALRSEGTMKAPEPSASLEATVEHKAAAPEPLQAGRLYHGASKDQIQSRSDVAQEAAAGKRAVQPDIILLVNDPETAGDKIKKIVGSLGGTITRKDDMLNRRILSIKLPSDTIKMFYQQIEALGEVREIAAVSGEGERVTVIRLALERIISE